MPAWHGRCFPIRTSRPSSRGASSSSRARASERRPEPARPGRPPPREIVLRHCFYIQPLIQHESDSELTDLARCSFWTSPPPPSTGGEVDGLCGECGHECGRVSRSESSGTRPARGPRAALLSIARHSYFEYSAGSAPPPQRGARPRPRCAPIHDIQRAFSLYK